MINRVWLFISRNFFKLITPLVLVSTVFALILTITSLTNVVSKASKTPSLTTVNVMKNYELENFDKSLSNSHELYDKSKELKGFTGYRVDTYGYFSIMEETSQVIEQILFDENHIDFTSKNAQLTQGELYGDGIVVSKSYADQYNHNIGDKVNFTSIVFAEYDEEAMMSDIDLEDLQVNYIESAPKIEVEIIGIYEAKNPENILFMGGIGETADFDNIYLSYDTFLKTNKVIYDNLSLVSNEENLEYLDIQEGNFSYERYLSQFDNKDSVNEFIKYAKEKSGDYSVKSSDKEMKSALKPINKFVNKTYIAFIVIVLFSLVTLYLSYYLICEKRKKELIALTSFGLKKSKIVLQTFIEFLTITIIGGVFGFLLYKLSFPIILDTVKKYYFVVVENTLNESITSGGMFNYLSPNTSDIVNFESVNIITILGISSAILLVIVAIVSIFETIRVLKNIDRM
ncbi:MAG: FtsX-like permease family protein [Bacilli bacterium]